MIHNKSDFINNVDRSFLIESVIDIPKEGEDQDDDDNKLDIIKDEEENKKENKKK